MSSIPVISREIDLTSYKGVQPGRSRRITIQPDNLSTYTSSDSTADIFFSIPQSSNSFIQTNCTQLVLNVLANATFASGTGATSLCNGDGSSIVQSLETVVQNQQIEQTLNYATYAAMINDCQGVGRSASVGSIMNGATTTLKAGASLSAATTVDGVPVRCVLSLHSGLIGTGAEQYCYMGMSGIRIKLTLATSNNALVITTPATAVYKLSNISLQLEVMDFDAATINAIAAQGNGTFKQHMVCVNNYTSVIQAATQNNVLIPARFSSVKALLCAFRLSANLSSPATENIPGDRLFPKIGSYYFQVDGANVPSVPVLCADSATNIYCAEALSEVMKVFGASNSNQFETVFAKANYEDAAGTSGTGSFMLGINFESQDSAGSALISGRDLNSSNCYLNLSHYTTALASVCDTFALYDQVITYDIASGTVSQSK